MLFPKQNSLENENSFAIIIPYYNHGEKIREVVKQALKLNFPIIVVDDGSSDLSRDFLEDIQGIVLLRHEHNMGKGAAIMTGFAEAAQQVNWAFTMDADGQHHPEDAWEMLKFVPIDKRPIIVGMRKGMEGGKVPWTSRFGRKFSNFWVWVSGGPMMEDSQSGFRLYPLPESMNLNVKARRFQFEVEILVKAVRRQIPVKEVPVRVTYETGSGRVSHFHPFFDFLRNSGTFARLIFQRIFFKFPK